LTDLKHDFTADVVQLFAKKTPVSIQMSAESTAHFNFVVTESFMITF